MEPTGYDQKKKGRLVRVSVVDQVCDALKQEIFDHKWEEGDKLPSESELAEYFGVNRLSVRMALQKLSTLGLIETRVGEGSFVRTFSLTSFFHEISGLYADKDRQREVRQLRNLLEGESMKLACQNAAPEEMQRLKLRLDELLHCVENYRAAPDDPQKLEKIIHMDYLFHYEIIKMSHNRLYQDIYRIIYELIQDSMRQIVSERVKQQLDAGDKPLNPPDPHVDMYKSILTGDLKAAQLAREQAIGIIPIPGMDYFESN